MRNLFADLLFLAGLAAAIYGVWLMHAPVAITVAGTASMWIAWKVVPVRSERRKGG